MKKILVPCDGSENALRAVRYGAGIARDDPSVQLALLHVLDPMTFRSHAASLPPDELTRLYPEEAGRVLQPARQILDAEGVRYQIRCRLGDPAGEIAAEVYESACDSVVMGTRGMGSIANLMIGSVAARVVHFVNVPVTLIK